MSAVERLQAAIDKLEALRAESTQGEWGFESVPETGESRIYAEADGFAFMAATTVTFYPVPGGMKPSDADLIATLHRTIDAQLAILRTALDVVEETEEGAIRASALGMSALGLAHAILGDQS